MMNAAQRAVSNACACAEASKLLFAAARQSLLLARIFKRQGWSTSEELEKAKWLRGLAKFQLARAREHLEYAFDCDLDARPTICCAVSPQAGPLGVYSYCTKAYGHREAGDSEHEARAIDGEIVAVWK